MRIGIGLTLRGRANNAANPVPTWQRIREEAIVADILSLRELGIDAVRCYPRWPEGTAAARRQTIVAMGTIVAGVHAG